MVFKCDECVISGMFPFKN